MSLQIAKSHYLELVELDRIRAKYWTYRSEKIPWYEEASTKIESMRVTEASNV